MTAEEFEACVNVPDPLERHLRAAAVVTEALAGNGPRSRPDPRSERAPPPR